MIEYLEPRIAPAVVTVNAGLKTATWIDYDGDFVTMKWSSVVPPTFVTENKGLGLLVDRLILNPADHSNASFTITVKTAGGDGRLEFGRVDATSTPLNSWVSPLANVAEFDAGNGAKAITSLVIGALGAIPHSNFAGNGGNGESFLNGPSGILSIRGDVGAASLNTGTFKSLAIFGSVHGDATGGLAVPGQLTLGTNGTGVVIINGSVIGGDAAFEGSLNFTNRLTQLTVKGSILGSSGAFSGSVNIPGTGVITSVSVLGSIIGGSATGAGNLLISSTNTMTALTIGGHILGGTAAVTGVVTAGPVTTFTLGGTLFGGTEENTGNILLQRAGTVNIKGSIFGGRETSAAANELIGTLKVTENLRTLTVNGDVIAGTFGSGTQVGYNGAILVGKNLTTATIRGSMFGNSEHEAILMATGLAPATAVDYFAISRLSILGGVTQAYIASGQAADLSSFAARFGNAENPDAGIGQVLVSGDWMHSSLNGGLNDLGNVGIDPGDTHSTGDPARTARIGLVAIKGYILDNPTFPGLSGIASTKIGSVTAGGVVLFKTGNPNRTVDPFGFVTIFET